MLELAAIKQFAAEKNRLSIAAHGALMPPVTMTAYLRASAPRRHRRRMDIFSCSPDMMKFPKQE
jgi:hypothetical protein